MLVMTVSVNATHWMGGEITWECQGGGDYKFTLKIYRDCNGVAGPTNANLRVWNHPTLTTIPMVLISQTDISPQCNQVAGGPAPITCAGGGTGALEEFVFESAPTTISGTPPAQGWAFTWDGFSRNTAIDNLQNPGSYGITLRALMFAYNGQNAQPCYDSSPTFAEVPATILCTGYPFRYNQNAFDPDLDSLVYSFGEPLSDITAVFNPPTDPAPIPYQASFSASSPLPGTTLDPNNVPATINPSTGEISFTSFTQGNFVTVVKVESYRCGVKIAEVYREIQTVLLACGVNNPPVVTPPINGTDFFDTVYAGDLVTFNFNTTDNETLQDGSPQSNILLPSGNQFGANFNDPNNGCPYPPCAVLSNPIPLTGVQGINTDFSWQTSCDHINTASGCATNGNTYTFVFKVIDDFCPAPGTSMPTISITVLAPPALEPPDLKCVSVNLDGSITLDWIPPIDTSGSFQSYDIYSSTSGGVGSYTLVANVNNYAQTSYTDLTADGNQGSYFYYMTTTSGCGGNFVSDSSAVGQSMYLDVVNPATGTVELFWNEVFDPNSPTSEGIYNIQRQIPSISPAWITIASVPYGVEDYIDTIDVCSDSITYRIVINDLDANGALHCASVSSVDGGIYSDILPPPPPEIIAISIDTATGDIIITWGVNPADDTQGYIVQHYQQPDWVLIDTIYGINNTTWTDTIHSGNGSSHWFGLAAFDSCISNATGGPNTSGRGGDHQTMFLEKQLDVCDREITLSWNSYVGWDQGVQAYEVYAAVDGGPMQLMSTNAWDDTVFYHSNLVAYSNYCYVIKALSNTPGVESLSNKICQYVQQPAQPWFNYIGTASVYTNDEIHVKVLVDDNAAVSHYSLQRTDNMDEPFEEVGQLLPGASNYLSYTDIEEVDAGNTNYYYQVAVIDSCGDTAMVSQIAKTILLQAYDHSDSTVNVLQWNHYGGWNGNIVEYRLYREVNGVWDATPIAVLPPQMRVYEDYVGDLIADATGEFCYRVEAIESVNTYGISETAMSNFACAYQDPKVWIPNAFIIGGHNNIFKPVIGYIDIDTYQMNIYNRWGQRIFETTDAEEGWDGRIKGGKEAQEGVYVYHIIYNTSDDKRVERRGSVTLLKGGLD